MDYERDTTFTNMYLGTEFRFDGLARALAALLSSLTPQKPKPAPIEIVISGARN